MSKSNQQLFDEKRKKKPTPGIEPTKFCVDCTHCTSFGLAIFKCRAAVSLVTGEKRDADCFEMRHAGEVCGPEGRLYEPKPPHAFDVVS